MSRIYFFNKKSQLSLLCLLKMAFVCLIFLQSVSLLQGAAFSWEEKNKADFLKLQEDIRPFFWEIGNGSKEKLIKLTHEHVRALSGELKEKLSAYLAGDEDYRALKNPRKLEFVLALNYAFFNFIKHVKWLAFRSFYSTNEHPKMVSKISLKDQLEINFINKNLLVSACSDLSMRLSPEMKKTDFIALFDCAKRDLISRTPRVFYPEWFAKMKDFEFAFNKNFAIDENHTLILSNMQAFYELQLLGLFVGYRGILENGSFEKIINMVKEIFSKNETKMLDFEAEKYCDCVRNHSSFFIPFIYLVSEFAKQSEYDFLNDFEKSYIAGVMQLSDNRHDDSLNDSSTADSDLCASSDNRITPSSSLEEMVIQIKRESKPSKGGCCSLQ